MGEGATRASPKKTGSRTLEDFVHLWALTPTSPPSPHLKTLSGCLFSLHERTQPHGQLILSQGRPFLGGLVRPS